MCEFWIKVPEFRFLLTVLMPFLLIALTSCGPEPAEEEPTPPIEEPEAPAPPPGLEAPAVQVGLSEYTINMPPSIPAGNTTFQVTNNGTMEHNFEIEGQGIEQTFPANLQAGESQSLQVDLQPGIYTVYCPVSDHRSQGMQLQLQVTQE
ncbi:MAG: cupredoxin domain-containing protein [Acidobacteriota bacterium]